jgi:hypothetical protein
MMEGETLYYTSISFGFFSGLPSMPHKKAKSKAVNKPELV